jgi:acetolactate synthase-1/2/3 large subunit
MSLPSIIKLANAYNIPSETISNHEGINEKIKNILNSKGPFICEVMINPDQPTSPRVSSIKLKDGSMTSKPLEDMWPFLERSEFEENMTVD